MVRLAPPLAFLLAAAAANAAARRQPVNQWTLDYGGAACTAYHDYDRPGGKVTLALRPSPNGKVVRVAVGRRGYAIGADEFEAIAEIGGRRVATTGLRFGSRDHKNDVIWINFQRSDLEALRQDGSIAIRGSWLDDIYPLPAIGAVLDGLDKCNDDLRHAWHVDGVGTGALSKPATPLRPLREYFSSDDYPRQALRASESGASTVMLMIDPAGKPVDCMVEKTSGIATLDATTCIVLLARAKFNPALDATGKPVRSVLTQTVRWRS